VLKKGHPEGTLLRSRDPGGFLNHDLLHFNVPQIYSRSKHHHHHQFFWMNYSPYLLMNEKKNTGAASLLAEMSFDGPHFIRIHIGLLLLLFATPGSDKKSVMGSLRIHKCAGSAARFFRG